MVRFCSLCTTHSPPRSFQVSQISPIKTPILTAMTSFLVGMLFWNYHLCVVTDPGRVPDSWVCTHKIILPSYNTELNPQHPDPDSNDGYEVKKLTGNPRFCRTCEKYKPPRAHHCKQCNRSVHLQPSLSRVPYIQHNTQMCPSHGYILPYSSHDSWLIFYIRTRRPPLSLGEQLHWPLQLRALHPFPLLRGPCVLIPSDHGHTTRARHHG